MSANTDMSFMFYGAGQFNQDLSGWQTSLVRSMLAMFYGAYQFDSDLSGWDTSSVTDMRFTFGGATSFTGDVSGWNTGSVASNVDMFYQGETSAYWWVRDGGCTPGQAFGNTGTAAFCAILAGQAGCPFFMFSHAYPAWGCYCCDEPLPGLGNPLD
eukprot:3627651-Rhodomonas_salina.1